ncbi:MAG: M48 family metalloprotease [Elainellaceae cyanobacterium]
MKHLKRLALTLLSAALVVCWSGPTLLSRPALSIAPSAAESPEAADAPVLSGQPIAFASPAINTFIEADTLYRNGDVEAAAALYRQVKPDFETTLPEIPEPVYDPEALSPETQVYWAAAQAAMEEGDEEAAIEPLQQVFAAQPEFIDGTLTLAQMLQEEDQEEEAIAVLEQAAVMYPDSAEIVMAQVLALAEEDEHLEASIAAREFALLNLDHPQSREFQDIADEEFGRFQKKRRRRGIFSGIGNILTRVFTGDAPWESWDSVLETAGLVRMMVGSESEVGAQLAAGHRRQVTLVEDPEVVDYVTQLGLQVARLSGRDLEYEFFVVQDDAINASAFPGGKIFVNTGAIKAAKSQAELAGLLAHEVSHSVLSHGLQSFFRDDMMTRLGDEVPLGQFAATMLSMHFSRKQERQSDVLGNRILSTAGYAADGLRNFFVTLDQMNQSQSLDISLLSTHPVTSDRVEYLEQLIQRNGYNRYALEGVDKHSEIRAML